MISLQQKGFTAAVPWALRSPPPALLFHNTRRFYSDEVHNHFKNPRNVGAFDKSEPNVGTAIVGKAACGDVIKLQVKIEGDTIKDVRFKTFGCGSAIASSSLASELIKGRTMDDALGLKNTDIAGQLSLPPVKIHCSLLAEDAIKLAIENYREKKAKMQGGPEEASL